MTVEKFPPIFNPAELDQNEERKRALIELVASRESLSLVGAGSSAFVSYDTWPRLLEKLENLAEDCGAGFRVDDQKRKNNPLEYAQAIKDYIAEHADPNKYHKLIYELYKPRNPSCDDFHRTLVGLPFKGILTTNYDIVLESALGENNPYSPNDWSLVVGSDDDLRVSEFLLSLDSKKYPRRVAHLHGIYSRSASIILSLKDYVNAYGLTPADSAGRLQDAAPSWSPHRKLLWAILATRRVVFLGFGMTDPFLMGMLEFVSADLWRWDDSIHFAVMSIRREDAELTKLKAKKLRKEYGVEVVFYEDFDGSHSGLRSLVAEVAEKCGAPATSDEIPLAESDARRMETERAVVGCQEQEGPAVSSGWLEAVNKRMEKRIRPDED